MNENDLIRKLENGEGVPTKDVLTILKMLKESNDKWFKECQGWECRCKEYENALFGGSELDIKKASEEGEFIEKLNKIIQEAVDACDGYEYFGNERLTKAMKDFIEWLGKSYSIGIIKEYDDCVKFYHKRNVIT